MKKISSSHISRHCSIKDSHVLVNILASRIKMISSYLVSEVTRGDIKYLRKSVCRSFDLQEGIEVMSDLVSNPKATKIHTDYAKYLVVLNKVLEDRLKYGDLIPETSDINEDEYIKEYESRNVPKCSDYKHQREVKLNNSKKRQSKFNESFKNFDWENHFKKYE